MRTIRIDTNKYQGVHGHKPRQPRGQGAGGWAFQIDLNPEPVFMRGTYAEALRAAKKQAQYSVTVLP